MPPKIALVTGTFGKETQNGVGRFLSGLEQYSREHEYPLDVFSSGDHLDNYPAVHNIHALSFPIPNYHAIEGYYPLEGRRRQLRRDIKKIGPDIIHLSTPDAIGMTGLGVAQDLDIPVAAVYHTDFPAYVRKLVQDTLLRQVQSGDGAATLSAIGGPFASLMREELSRHIGILEWLAIKILRRRIRNKREEIQELLGRGCENVAQAAEVVVQEVMHQFYAKCGLVIARSDMYRDLLVGKMGLDDDKVKTLKAGVDTETFTPEKSDADVGLRGRLGIPEDAQVVLYVGRVSDEKNVSFLADAWRLFQSKKGNGKAVLLMVGSGGQAAEFEQRAGKNVRMLGARHGAELSAIYRLADVFWTASKTETLGQVVLEAQASGVPTLVTNQGASQENVKQGETGFVLPVDSPQRWADSLGQVLGNPDRRRQMAAAARASVSGKGIADSFQHFWRLHEDMHEREHDKERFPLCGQLSIQVAETTLPLPFNTPEPRTTHVSDFHAGHGAKTKHKEGAMTVIADRARSRGADVHFHGDFTDTRPPLRKMRKELKMVRKVLGKAGLRPKGYIEGNHDYEFARSGELEEMIGCPVDPSLVTMLDGGLVITHGHVSEIRELPDILAQCKTKEEILAALSVRSLASRLKQTALEYDITGVFQNWLEKAGLDGLEDLWRNIFPYRQRFVDAILGEAHRRQIDTKAIGAIVQMVGSNSREKTLSQLCAAMGGHSLVYGHTHEPHLTVMRAWDPVGGVERDVLLGNSGSMRRRRLPPTWIEVQGKTMELYAYDHLKDREVLVDRKSV